MMAKTLGLQRFYALSYAPTEFQILGGAPPAVLSVSSQRMSDEEQAFVRGGTFSVVKAVSFQDSRNKRPLERLIASLSSAAFCLSLS